MDQNLSLFAENNSRSPKPFLKWAGGKSRLLFQYKSLFPEVFNNYFEPFCGSAAVFFYLKTSQSKGTVTFKDAKLSDINQELILTYQIVRDNVIDLIELLYLHRQNHDQEYYYRIRSLNTFTLSDLEKAARFVYLNKTCFNGLYRVNSKGQFNVPIGNYKHPQIFNELDLKAASKSLQEVTIQVDNFGEVLTQANKGDFVYLDPPYAPLSKTASFTSYTKNPFGERGQFELSELFKALDRKGCKVMLSNSWVDHIIDLYKDFNCLQVQASRAINSNITKRGRISELVVMNY
jgi:DNA adenine methylase